MINKKTTKGKISKELLDDFYGTFIKKSAEKADNFVLADNKYIDSLNKKTTYLRDDITAMLRNPDLKIVELEYLLDVVKLEIKRNQLLENDKWLGLDDEYPDGF